MAGETTTTPAAQQPDESLLHSLASSAGIDPEAVIATAKAIRAHPWQVAKDVGSAQAGEFVDAAHHLRETAKSAINGVASAITNPEAKAAAIAHLKSPGFINKLQGAEEYATSAIPLFGGGIVKSEEQGGQGNIPGMIGTLAGTIGPLLTDTEGVQNVKTHLAETGKTFVESAKEGLQRAATATAPEGSLEAGYVKVGGKKIAPAVERRGPATFARGQGTFPETVNRTFDTMRAQAAAGEPGTSIEAPDIRAEGPEWERTHRAVVNGETVGSAGYKVDPDGQAQIYGAHTNMDLRGKGIMQKVYRNMIYEARAGGASSITSDSTSLSPDAARVWEKLRAKGLPVEDITHPNGKAGYKIDFDNPPEPTAEPTEAQKQTLARRGQLPGQTINMGEVLGDTGKYVGGLEPVAPTAPVYHPDLQKLADHFGTSTDASKVQNGASFIAPDGKFVHLAGGTTHDSAIDWAKGQTQITGDNRPEFLNDTGAVRTRFTIGKKGAQLAVSVPEGGISPEQIDSLKQAVAQVGRNGNLTIERADIAPETKDELSKTKEFATPKDVEPLLKQIGAHPDQADTLLMSERQSALKEPYLIEIQNPDGTSHTEPIEAFSSKAAIAAARKKFPEANQWDIASSGKRAPSDEYSVPDAKLHTMPASEGRTVFHTIRHELGHAMVGQNEGMVQKGMISHVHPDARGNVRAGVLWDGKDLYNTYGGSIKTEKLPAVLRGLMGGIAADEVFNDVPRAANHNFRITSPGSDGQRAYQFLKAEGVSHEQAMDYMHQAIEDGKAYLTKPEVSGIIKENENAREAGLSRQYHYSPERLQNMHAETQRRIQSATTTEGPDNRAISGEADTRRPAADAAGKGGSAEATGESVRKEITTAEVKKPAGITPKIAQQIVDAHAANGGSTFSPTQGDLEGTDNYAVSTNPERGQVLKAPPTAKDIQDFATKNKDLLANPEKSIGTWHDTSNDTHALDIVSTLPDREKAIALGKENNQKAIFHLKTNTEIPTGGTGEVPVGGTVKAPAAPAAPAGSEKVPTVSTRVPTKTVKGETVEDHTNHSLTSDMDAAKAAPGYVQKMAKKVQTTPGFKAPEGGDAQATADAYIRHVADNVKFVHGKMSPEEIARGAQWYPVGAHGRVLDVAKKYGFTPTQITGVTAVESPMTDWDANTSLAERTADVWKNQQNTKFTPEMQQAADRITNIPANAKFKSFYKSLKGKTLAELPTVGEKAHWLRLYDEAHNPRDYQTWKPDGTSSGLAKNKDGSNKKVGWSFQNHIEKAIRILQDGSPENISQQLGYGHKVRNFYNNMISPDDPRYLTIDTHAVNGGQLRPMSGKHPSVSSNFGQISNGPHGLSGTYPMHDAGYRLAAKELDIPIPSRLQSPVWEKIREVFTDDFKTPENLAAIDAIWKEHSDGKITADQARNRVWDYATRWNDEAAAKAQHPSDQGKLFKAGVRGEPAEGTAGRGDRGATPGGVSDEDTSFDFGANVKLTAASAPPRTKAKVKGQINALDFIKALKTPGPGATIPKKLRQTATNADNMNDPDTRFNAARHEAAHSVISEALNPGSVNSTAITSSGGVTDIQPPAGKITVGQLSPDEVRNMIATSFAGGMSEQGGTTIKHASGDLAERKMILGGRAAGAVPGIERLAFGSTIGPDPMLQANTLQAEAKARVNALLADPAVQRNIDTLTAHITTRGKLSGDEVRNILRSQSPTLTAAK